MKAPLAGVRVLELTHAIAGPQCGQILADHGADVVKIEPMTGERARNVAPHIDGASAYFASHNRGKRSICIDLKKPEGQELLLDLCERADVLLTNYRADVPERYGWSFADVSARNPTIVYAHITGFGSQSEHRSDRAYDGIIQAMSGVPALTGPAAGPPMLSGAFIADHVTAYQAAIGILLGLQGRAASGSASHVDISMFQSYFSTLAHDVATAAVGNERSRSANKVLTGFSDTYPSQDGTIFIAPLGEDAWARFCTCIGRDDWLGVYSYQDSLEAARPQLEEFVAQWIVTRTSAQALAELNAAGIACGPVRTVRDAVRFAEESTQPGVAVVTTPRGVEVTVPAAPISFGLAGGPNSLRIPSIGQHTSEVLRELGIDPDRLGELMRCGAVADSPMGVDDGAGDHPR